jgi:hypothetical protein
MPTVSWNDFPGKVVYVSSGTYADDQTVSGALQQLSRVQGIDWDLAYGLSDQIYMDGGIDQYRPIPIGVDVTLDFYHTNGVNERYLGLGRFTPSGQLELGLEDERNLYVAFEDNQGVDAIGATYTAPRTVLGLAQGVLTSYQMSAAVGGFVEARATLNYLTAAITTGTSGVAPSVDYQLGTQRTGRFVLPAPTSQYNSAITGASTENVAAIAAHDMVMMFPDNSPFGVVFTGQQACFLQAFQLGLTVNRAALKPLGYAYPSDRPVMWPIPVDLNTEALVGKYQADNLRRLGCTVTGQQINVVVKQPCSATTMFGMYFTDLQVVGQSFAAGIGDTDRVTTRWRGYLRRPSDTFISPFWNTLIRLDTTGEWGGHW